MKINPFELHPETSLAEHKKKKKFLTKEEVFLILKEEIKRTESLPPSTWGLTREDILEALENVYRKIQEN